MELVSSSITSVTPVPLRSSNTANSELSNSGFDLPRKRQIQKLWDICCNEIAAERDEIGKMLERFGLRTMGYSKDLKSFPWTKYDENNPPDLKTCESKDFLDHYIFPVLLPAIESLLNYAKMNRVLKCRYCTFVPMDYIVEYLYNNNPFYPERKDNPVELNSIPFVENWLKDHPRAPPPKWFTISPDDAAIIIQKNIRGFITRRRPEIMELRQFWKDIKQDHCGDQLDAKNELVRLTSTSQTLFSPYYTEISEDRKNSPYEVPLLETHSDSCLICQKFKDFLQSRQEELDSKKVTHPSESKISVLERQATVVTMHSTNTNINDQHEEADNEMENSDVDAFSSKGSVSVAVSEDTVY